MNKNQIISSAMRVKQNQRAQAEILAGDALVKLRQIDEFKRLDNALRALKLDLSKALNKSEREKITKQIANAEKNLDAYLLSIKFPKNLLSPQYSCKKCNDTGFVNGKTCTCLDKVIQEKMIQQSGINSGLLFDFSQADYALVESDNSLKTAYTVVKKYISEFPNFKFPNLVFEGDVGSGKTFLLECLATELLKKGFYVVFSTSYDVNKTMMNSFKLSPDERNSVLEPFFESDLLIIDDLGSEPMVHENTIANFFTIINERQRKSYPTIISTNLSPSEINQRYGERLKSRIFNKRITLALKFTAKDLRLKI